DAGTFAEAFRITAANRENEIFVRTKGDDVALTWREVRERVDALAGGLAKLGLARGQSMAILLTNRPEFHIADLAAVTLGATPFYTSGTTGPPKGVQIAHRNMMAGVRSTEDIIHFPDGSRVISWLPAAHIAERAAHHYLPIGYGFQVTCCPNPRDVMAYLPDVRPQWFFAVPRIWEKLKAGLETMLAGLPDEQRAGAQAAVDAAIEKVRLEQRGEPVPDELAENGEGLVGSEGVMVGYRNMPDRTAEALDADGWLHTGDIGEFDEDGYLKIVDRKKEIIINKAGKNMSPAYIESHLKSSSSL